MASQDPHSSLQELNSATLGAHMPEITLPNGDKVQTGSVGAMLVNIREYDTLIEAVKSSKSDVETAQLRAKAAILETALKAPLPLLKKVGLFDLFKPQEWLDGDSPGRKLVGKYAIEAGY